MPYRLSGSGRGALRKLIDQKITVVVESEYDTFHGDDIDHGGPKTSTHEGVLSEIFEDGVIVTGDGEGFPRVTWRDGMECCQFFRGTGRAYYPFHQHRKTELSESEARITLITHNDKPVYRG